MTNQTGRALVHLDGEFREEVIHPTTEFFRDVRNGQLDTTMPQRYFDWN